MKAFPLTVIDAKNYSFATLPKTDFAIPAGTVINKMTVIFKGTMLDGSGNSINVSSIAYEKLFDDLK